MLSKFFKLKEIYIAYDNIYYVISIDFELKFLAIGYMGKNRAMNM